MSGREAAAASRSQGSDRSRPTVRDALAEGRRVLTDRSAEAADREARFLLAGVLRVNPGAVWLRLEHTLGEAELEEYRSRLARRHAGEPLQYIERRAAFRDLELRVTPAVLIPRPETEQLVEHVLDWAGAHRELTALDLGTGSGAIAIALATEGGFRRVVGVDISEDALNVARDNVEEVGVGDRVELRAGRDFSALQPGERFDAIVSNPPYIAHRDAVTLPAEVRDWEPVQALLAGATGSEVIERIVTGAPLYLRAGGLLALEIASAVAGRAAQSIREAGVYREPVLIPDLAGRTRIVLTELERVR